MKRILVPLDGSKLSMSIIPEARRLAGPDGTLILVHDVRWGGHEPAIGEHNLGTAIVHSDHELDSCAVALRAQGVNVEIGTLIIANTSVAIDEAAKIFKADMIACATHGRGPVGRLVHGGVAWRAVANSPVPVLLRHVEDAATSRLEGLSIPRILVPLDGSEYSETALPIAADLASQWNAEIYLIQVIPDPIVSAIPFGNYAGMPSGLETDVRDAREQLQNLASALPGAVHVLAATGGVVEMLVHAVSDWNITHVVMASHGRTGLSRIILGSTADELIHGLHCPIVVIPALVTKKIAEQSREVTMVGSAT